MDAFCMTPYIEGCGTGAGLLIAIGAQNAFVLKQGILKNHVLVTVLICAIIDALLILFGVKGFGAVLNANTFLMTFSRWAGAIFLFYYGLRSFWSVFKSESLKFDLSPELPSLKTTIATILALTLLNPHVYLDTVVLLGSIGAQFSPTEQPFFALGAITSSFIWFFSLGYGARYLSPLFTKPAAWKILDFFVGCTMWGIAISLLFWNPERVCY